MSADTVSADFVIDPTSHTDITAAFSPVSGGDTDDGDSGTRALDTTFDFYGTNRATLRVNANGSITFGAASTLFNNDGVNGTNSNTLPRISAWFDDLQHFASAAGDPTVVRELDSTDMYVLTVTDSRVRQGGVDNTSRVGYQTILFGSNQTIGGFNFLANDIAISYEGLANLPSIGDLTVGLSSGTVANNGVPIPGDADGVLSYSDLSLLPAGDNLILFRADGNGGYTASIEQIPEPGSLALLGLAGLTLVRRRRK